MDDFAEIEAALTKLSDDEGNLRQGATLAIQAVEKSRLAKDRTFIVKCVVSLYCVAIGGTILYLICRGLFSKDSTFSDISEIIKIAVVPILTLVIGYYFSKSE